MVKQKVKAKQRLLRFLCLCLLGTLLLFTIILVYTLYASIPVYTKKIELSKLGSPEEIIYRARCQALQIKNKNNFICESILAEAQNTANLIYQSKIDEVAKTIPQEKRIVSSLGVILSEEDFNLLCKIVYAEAGNQSVWGQQAVCWVILNRQASKSFPSDIRSIIYAPGQFDPVRNGSINCSPPTKTKEAVRDVILGNVPDMTYGAVFFCEPRYSVKSNLAWFATKQMTTVIGCHHFYK